jgi:hypothetical protein
MKLPVLHPGMGFCVDYKVVFFQRLVLFYEMFFLRYHNMMYV